MTEIDTARIESLGPAEQTIQTLLSLTDHMVHNRPGIVSANNRSPFGFGWQPCTWVQKDGVKSVFLRCYISGENHQIRMNNEPTKRSGIGF